MTSVVLIGAGAQAKYACETFGHRGIEIVGVVDVEQRPGIEWTASYRCRVLHADPSLQEARRSGATHALVCMADIGAKVRWWDHVSAADLTPLSAVHPSAVIASTARVGEGCIVNACAVIQPFAVLGRGVMVHANVTVEHDAVVGDFVNLAPGVRLAGWVHVEECATVFTGAAVIPSVRIGRKAVVGAGAAVTEDVPPGAVVVGVPARVLTRPRRTAAPDEA